LISSSSASSFLSLCRLTAQLASKTPHTKVLDMSTKLQKARDKQAKGLLGPALTLYEEGMYFIDILL